MEFFTVQEISKMLKIHEQTIFRWIREGKLESIKVGRNQRVTKEQLDNFLNKNKEE
jgi:excisionase family DNA binding protein